MRRQIADAPHERTQQRDFDGWNPVVPDRRGNPRPGRRRRHCRCLPCRIGALPLHIVADVPLGGRTTRLDYESLDASRHLLFIAHLGDSEVIVFDTERRRVVTGIPGISRVHGVLAIPEPGVVYASATGTNEVVAIGENSSKVTARMPGGIYPDGPAFAPEAHKAYVSDEHGGTDTVIDVRTNAVVATVRIGGDIGNTPYDRASHPIFVNAQSRAELVEVGAASG